MPLQRTEGPVYIPRAKRDSSQQGPDVRIHSALQQGASQNPVSQNAINPSKDTRKEPRKDPGKDAIKKPRHADAKLAGARKKKPGVEERPAPPWSLAGFTISPEEIARFEANPESLKAFGGLCLGGASR